MESHPTSTSLNHWSGWLAPQSIVMAVRRKVDASVASLPELSPSEASSSETSPLRLSGEGPANARVMFVGSALEGAAAQLFDRMIEAIGLRRADVYITSSFSFLNQEISAIQPEVIVAMGDLARTPLESSAYASRTISTFHPEQLLQTPAAKKSAWEDLKKVAARLGLVLPVKV